MPVASKLQLKPGQGITVLNQPDDIDLDVAPGADAVLFFAAIRADLDDAGAVIDAAKEDRLAWVAYPKAGQLGTDLNRDSLAAAMAEQGVRAVRQVALDDVWSALRFRPA